MLLLKFVKKPEFLNAEISGMLNSKDTKNQRERNSSAASDEPELLDKQSP